MRLGPLRARIITHIATARAILAQKDPSEREMRALREKLERACESLSRLITEWTAKVEDQVDDDTVTEWETDYRAQGEGDGGFLKLLEDARDISGELVGVLETHIRETIPAPIIQQAHPQEQAQPQGQGQGHGSSVRLPPTQLPIFMGKHIEWLSYWSIFESTVDKNNSYSEAEKMGYLLLTLGKPQQDEIRGYQLTTGGYALAKQYLKSRYGNETFIKRAMYKEIKELPVAKRIAEVRSNWVTLNRLLLQLEKLNEDIISQSLLQEMELKFHEWVLREVVSEQIQAQGQWHQRNFWMLWTESQKSGK